MATYRVREVRIFELDGGVEKISPLREYEFDSAGEPAAVEEVRQFFEVEILSLKAPQKIDFDALVVVDSRGVEVARFKVSMFGNAKRMLSIPVRYTPTGSRDSAGSR